MNAPSVQHIINTAEVDGFFLLNNNTSNPLVLFGNCHMGPLAWFLNILTNRTFDIYVIISYTAHRNGTSTPDYKNKIIDTVRRANVFIYQHHNSGFGIDAHIIDSYANCFTIKIPNLQLRFTDCFDKPVPDCKLVADYNHSLQITTNIIAQSDFPNFSFVIDNAKTIRFFDIPSHPTQYLLYLLSLQVFYRITERGATGSNRLITLRDYFDRKNDSVFVHSDHVHLGSYYIYNPHQCMLLGFDLQSEHYLISPTVSSRYRSSA